ncbi:CoA-binding protein [Fervidicella metallireducens AeB]|uniref:CoA-binding protein n=1 Tax=Fervidicella metallireducens AeB TaxID=1403537 RepID=A0A017S0B5_9CLOT|nr:CoA-binding protein [Fervidicella metallireducens]EYE89605.1 CoA-binding protein [Fervidicella metallireducens AeB]
MALKEFMDRKVWAVVGSVSNKEKFAYKIYNFLKKKGYKVYAVDPSGKDVDGEKSYKTLSEVPETIEAVDMVINPVKGLDFLDEANRLGIKYIWFQPGAENSELIEKAQWYGMNVVYDRCVMVDF